VQCFCNSGRRIGVLFYGDKSDGREWNLSEHYLSIRDRNDAMVLDRAILVADGTAISIA
jgi:hypothetical protein